MTKFNSIDSAMEYANLNLGKNDYEIVEIGGTKTFISSTTIPLERFRDPIEEIVDKFLSEMGMEDENERLDIAMFIGAEMSSKLIEMIEENSPYGIACSYVNY